MKHMRPLCPYICNITFELFLKQSEVCWKIMLSAQWLGWVFISRACFRKIFQFIIRSWLIYMGLSPWAAYVCILAPLTTSVIHGRAFVMRLPVVLSVPDVCKDFCVQVYPKRYGLYQAVWKFCGKFVMLVSLSLTDGTRLLHSWSGIRD